MFLVCGEELVERDGPRLRTARIEASRGRTTLLSASSVDDDVIGRSSDNATLYWWHGDQVEQFSDGSSWRCADAQSRTAIAVSGTPPNARVHVVDLATRARTAIALSAGTIDAVMSLEDGCAISGARMVFPGKKSVELWRRGATRPDEIVGWLPKSESVSSLRLVGPHVGWTECFEERTVPRCRPRARRLVDRAPSRATGESVGPLNAVADNVTRIDFDAAGAAYTAASRSPATRFDDGVWKPFFEAEEPTSCYISRLQAGPDGRAALLGFACPPSSEGGGERFSVHSFAPDAAERELACPSRSARRNW